MSKDNIMVGKTIAAVHLATDKMAIRFVLTDGQEVVAMTDGDCCSHSWVEHLELPALGFPAAVLAVEEIKMDQPEQPDEYGRIAAYGCKLATDRGDLTIEYRNESNGYYGGSLEWPDENGEYDYYYGGVYGQNKSKCEWSQP